MLNELNKAQIELDNKKQLLSLYPDLREHTDRWNRKWLVSKSINDKATNFFTKYNCGCCNDSPLELYVFIETEFGRIYSDPCGIFIGDMNPWGGYENEDGTYQPVNYPSPNWKQELSKHNIPKKLIDNIEEYLGW